MSRMSDHYEEVRADRHRARRESRDTLSRFYEAEAERQAQIDAALRAAERRTR